MKVEWSKLLCSNIAPPKCIFIIWLNVLARLLTSDNLKNIGIDCELECGLCNNNDESIKYLFFECSGSGKNGRMCWIGWELEDLFKVGKMNPGCCSKLKKIVKLTYCTRWLQ